MQQGQGGSGPAGNDKKIQQLENFRTAHNNQTLTTNMGLKLSHTDDSLKAGERGPTLMEDFHFREKITHFDHERIPERVVHARGFGAYGYFQVYQPMTEYTKAKFLQDPSLKTPVFVRFSTVVGSRGSADTARDVRGFATKFYTEEGNYDIVGNNIPVFFIQDAIKFPDLIHAVKPEPHNEVPQATSAHDTFWDFVVNTPETAHMIMWLMSDRAIPRSFRMMEGFGVNTFRFVNAKGKARFVKFHWKPVLGVHSLVRDEAQKLSGKDPDFHRRDLWDAIDQGNYPEFEFGVQMLEEEQEFKFDFDILDPTKFWPEELVPVKIIGKMTLNRNVDNFFAETEQVAFCPGNVVPGIDFSNDPLLQGRLFSYQDTQLIRLGGPNFHQIPVNRPVAPIHNNQRDGYHRMSVDQGVVSYFPNMLQQNTPTPVAEGAGGYVHYAEKVEGRKIRERSKSFQDFFSQATLFWNSMSVVEKAHIIDAFHFEAGSVQDKQIKQRVVDMFNYVAPELARQIALGIGANPPSEQGGTGVTAASPAVSQQNTIQSPKTRKVAVLAANGFCYTGLTQVVTALTNAGVSADIVSSRMGMITSSDGKQTEAAKDFTTADALLYDAVYVPGGIESIQELAKTLDARNFVNEAFKHDKTIAAADDGVDFLKTSDAGKVQLAQPDSGGKLSSGLGVATVRGAADWAAFGEEFLKLIAIDRHWARHL
ncbi:catalase|uniref:Catalase n=1 Tax=Dendrosporobacter quercicolus TaxID=146817 RepID=A0A1G9NAG1_9FIRM|nr:catalase [Dendrosporobacter quercicolus]NSL47278.1 catalase [Dendrosporobacter quercicolus DSM 1736]SDL83449.1 catalase [Dendrosporobacter quercicolus]